MIQIKCPNGHTIEVPESYAGRTGKCTHCGAPVEIPGVSPPSTDHHPNDARLPLKPLVIVERRAHVDRRASNAARLPLKLLIASLLLGPSVGACIGVLLTMYFINHKEAKDSFSKTLYAREFVLTDESGQTAAKLEAIGGINGARLVFLDDSGNPKLTIASSSVGSMIQLTGEAGEVGIGLTKTLPFILLKDRNGKPRIDIEISASDNGGQIILNDPEGATRLITRCASKDNCGFSWISDNASFGFAGLSKNKPWIDFYVGLTPRLQLGLLEGQPVVALKDSNGKPRFVYTIAGSEENGFLTFADPAGNAFLTLPYEPKP